MSSNLYCAPEDHGLRTVGEIDFSDDFYGFDLLVVLERPATGELLYAEDSGCSCPSPFEFVPLTDWTLATRHSIAARIQERVNELGEGCPGSNPNMAQAAAALIEKVMIR